MSEVPAQVMFGYVPYPAIGYRMGGRQMVATAMTPVDFIGVVGPREQWDPLSGVGTNRKEDKAHRRAIAEYVEGTPDYVLNSILVYIGEKDAVFQPNPGVHPDAPIRPGVLYVRPGAKFKVGDGGHRTGAYTDVIDAHREIDDEVYGRLASGGQPLIVVLDDDHVRRAQDFTDLQRNAKPLSASIGQSMDRRRTLNRILIENVIKRSDIPVLDQGRRVEFLTDAPGKLSAKTMAYKTVRYASGTLLVGTGPRDARGWESAVELSIASDESRATRKIIGLWQAFGALPALADAFARDKGVALLRESTWLLTSGVIYAVAAAAHDLTLADDRTVASAVGGLGSFDFGRTDASPLVGTLVDKETGKAVAGRTAWEGAAARLADHMRSNQ